jgi:hypothetical protein
MKLDIFNIDKFIKINNCPEITNPIYIEKEGYFTSDGIFSSELLGRPGSYDRKTIFGYIDLKRKFFHPLVFKILIDLNRKIPEIVRGNKYVSLNKKGIITEDEVNGTTGIDFFIKNWEKIRWRQTGSKIRKNKIKFINSLKIDEIFITKYLVIPPYFRDINTIEQKDTSSISKDEVNNFYIKLLNYVKYLESSKLSTSFSFVQHNNISRTQFLLVEIYDYLIGTIEKKTGLIHKSLLGK